MNEKELKAFLADKSRNWILDGKKPIPATILEWGEMFEDYSKKEVGLTLMRRGHISTIFLGVDQGYSFDDSPPILFETMIFIGKYDGYQERYATWEEAEEGHKKAVKMIKRLKLPRKKKKQLKITLNKNHERNKDIG